MLSRDEDIVNADWGNLATLVLVLNNNLGLAVGAKPGDLT